MPREWDATTYDALPLPHEQWGRRVLDRLALTGSETVLDAGCGTGRDTAALLDRLPTGRVVAVDGSSRMLKRLRERLADQLSRVEVIETDLTGPLPVDPPVDAVVSVATFHWISDHAALFRNIADVVRPGGRLSAECGGRGNVERVSAAVDDVLGRSAPAVWNFAGPAETKERLEAAGFTDVDVALVPDPARLQPGEQLRTYLATVVLGSHLDAMPEPERAPFVAAVADRLDEPVVDYVRLTMAATRADR